MLRLNLFEQLLFKLNLAPTPIVDIINGAAHRCVSLAIELGVFENLKAGPLTADDIAQRLGANVQGIGSLLSLLKDFGYVKGSNQRYSNTAVTTKWLLKDSPSGLSNYVSMWNDLAFRFWDEYLERAIVDGKPPLSLYQWCSKQPKSSNNFQEAMMDLARLCSREVVSKIRIHPNAKRLLDIGGGHGLYSIGFCQMNPQLSATIIDQPVALEAAHRNIKENGLEDRIRILPGNYLVSQFDSGYDIALLFNVMHAHSPMENIELLQKVAAAVVKGGTVAIMEIFHGSNSRTMDSFANLLDFAFFASFGGQIHQQSKIQEWLDGAGFINVAVSSLRSAPGAKLIIGTRA